MNFIKWKIKGLIKKINKLLIVFGIRKNEINTPYKTKEDRKYFVRYKGEIITPNANLQKAYDEASVGDVFFCLMPLSPSGLSKIEASHRVRPYMILKKKKNIFLAIQSSSKPFTKSMKNRKLGQVKLDCSYFDLEKIYEVPVNNIKQYLTSYGDEQVNEVFRRMALLNLEGFENLLEIGKIVPETKAGDIILAGSSRFYINNINQNKDMTCFRVSPYNPNTKQEKISINGMEYQINTKKSFYFYDIKPESIEMVTDKNLKILIDEKIKKDETLTKTNTIRKEELKVGNIVIHKNNKYVISEMVDDFFVLYKAFPKRINDGDYWYKLSSFGVKYYVYLKDPIKTKLKGDVILTDHVELNSLEEIKQKLKTELEEKRSYKDEHWMDKYSFSNPVGTIYKHKVLDDEYIYLYNKGNTTFMVNANDYFEGDYMVEGFSKEFIDFEETDKSLYVDDLKTLLDELIEINHKDKRIMAKIKEDLPYEE